MAGRDSWMRCESWLGCVRMAGTSSHLQFFRHHREIEGTTQWIDGSPEFRDLFSPALEEPLGPRRRPDEPLIERHHDIARSAQAMYEEAFFHLLRILQTRTTLTDLALAGGCAMNSVANGKLRRKTGFRGVYVQAAADDAGGAIGSALTVWHKLGGKRSFVMDHAYWGPAFSAAEVEQLLSAQDRKLPPPYWRSHGSQYLFQRERAGPV
jgi:carbamoyltransferase